MADAQSGRSTRRFIVMLGSLAVLGVAVFAAVWAAPPPGAPPGDVALAAEPEPVVEQPGEQTEAPVIAGAGATAEAVAVDGITSRVVTTDGAWVAGPAEWPGRTSSRSAMSSSGLAMPSDVLPADDKERLTAVDDVLVWQPSWIDEDLPWTRWPMDIVASGLRTVYLTCDILSASNGWNIGLAKYVDGEQVWFKSYDGPLHSDDGGAVVAARGSAVYTAGARMTKDGNTDMVVSRWDSSGNRLWTKVYDSGARGWEFPCDCVVDGSGNLIVALQSESFFDGMDWAVVSYKSDGTLRWARRYDGPLHDWDVPVALRVDSANRIYVVGESESLNRLDTLVIKYSTKGERLWARRWNGGADDDDFAQDLRLRPGGGVYVAGVSWGADDQWRGLLLSYKADGTRVFALADSGAGADPASGGVWFDDLEVAPEGTVLCGGAQYVPEAGWQWLLVDVSSTGAVLSREVETSPAGGEVMRMAKDSQGGVCAAGVQSTDDSLLQFRTQRQRAGGVSWSSVWREGGDPIDDEGSDFLQAVAVNGVNVYVLGMRWVPASDSVEAYYSQCLMGHVY